MKAKLLTVIIILGSGLLSWLLASNKISLTEKNEPPKVMVDTFVTGKVKGLSSNILTFNVGNSELQAQIDSNTEIIRIDNVMGKSTKANGKMEDITPRSTVTVYYQIEKDFPKDRLLGILKASKIEIQP